MIQVKNPWSRVVIASPVFLPLSLCTLSSLPRSVPCQQSQTSHQEPLQLVNHLRLVGRTHKNFHFSSLPSRLERHVGILC